MEDEAPGVPEWVVTYGDMMSLLLTFFIMLVSLSEIVAAKKFQAIMQSIQEYAGYRNVKKAPLGDSFPLNSMVERLDTLGSFTKNRRAHGGVRQLAPAGDDLRVFSISQGRATRVGDRIRFNRRDAVLSAEARGKIAAATEVIVGKPNKIVIVGHVAGRDLPADAVANDKTLLSYLRAKAVMRELTRRNVEPARIRILAAGDTQPSRDPTDTRRNRDDRVEILLIDRFANHYRGPRAASAD